VHGREGVFHCEYSRGFAKHFLLAAMRFSHQAPELQLAEMALQEFLQFERLRQCDDSRQPGEVIVGLRKL
jgi:hypothetical protein